MDSQVKGAIPSPSITPRPLYLPVRVLITAETFTLSSNIIVDTSTFLLRYAGRPHRASPPSPGRSWLPAVCPLTLSVLICTRVMIPFSGMWIVSAFLEGSWTLLIRAYKHLCSLTW